MEKRAARGGKQLDKVIICQRRETSRDNNGQEKRLVLDRLDGLSLADRSPTDQAPTLLETTRHGNLLTDLKIIMYFLRKKILTDLQSDNYVKHSPRCKLDRSTGS